MSYGFWATQLSIEVSLSSSSSPGEETVELTSATPRTLTTDVRAAHEQRLEEKREVSSFILYEASPFTN